jgi:hypothetical protein
VGVSIGSTAETGVGALFAVGATFITLTDGTARR